MDRSPQGTVFLKTDFIKSLSIGYKMHVVYKGDKPVAGCVVLLDEKGSAARSPYSFVPYQGFFFIADDNEEAVLNHKAIFNQFKITEYFIEYLLDTYGRLSQTHFGLEDYRPFLWYNYHSPEKGLFMLNLSYTTVLDIQKYATLEEYLRSTSTLRRREHNKAQKGGVELRELKHDDLNVLFDLHIQTFKRQGLDVSSGEQLLVRSIASSALKKGYGRLTAAFMNGVPVSAILYLLDKKRGYYLIGANDPAFRDTSASTLLFVENIWRCKIDGLKEVDFVGCNSPQRGDYKLSFNGRLVPCFETHFNIS
ncbi:MAG: GNAT family N-acetyltransferase [Nitrospirota bacterium]